MLKLHEAASYCGIPASRFLAECGVDHVLMGRNNKRYDVRDLDAWLDQLKGNSLDDDQIIRKLRQTL